MSTTACNIKINGDDTKSFKSNNDIPRDIVIVINKVMIMSSVLAQNLYRIFLISEKIVFNVEKACSMKIFNMLE